MTGTPTITFHIDAESVRLISLLQQRLSAMQAGLNVSKAGIVRMAIRALAEREGIKTMASSIRIPGRPRKGGG